MLFRTTERLLLGIGLTLCAAYLAVMIYREVGSRMAVRSFETTPSSAAAETPAAAKKAGVESTEVIQAPDFSLWAAKRVAGYKESLLRHFAPPVAVLRIPKIHVEVAVFEGTDELSLNRGVGWIAGTARVGETGNIGIAGHRDGFFRVLKDIKVGDVITLTSLSVTTTYTVDQIEIVSPDDVRVLAPRPAPSVTLVTCYPFYYSGDAPQRFIVHGSRREERPNSSPGGSRADQCSRKRFKENET